MQQDTKTNSTPLPQRAVALAATLLATAKAAQTEGEHDYAQKIARMMDDPRGKALTIALSDQAFRSHRPARVADQLRHLLDRYGAPGYMEWWERTGLVLGGVMAHFLPSMVVPPLIARLRQETRSVILPGEEAELRRYLHKRRQSGTRLNLNQLGEAILGEEEAKRRLQAYLELLARADVEYISVKVSSIFSQINLVAFDATVEAVKDRLRTLYRQALHHLYQHSDGQRSPKFINLDMEEYRDLHLTVAAFCQVLDEAEFLPLSAGIVLQAYLPDSHQAQRKLTEWALQRLARGGAPVKVRIVKGANLAMERVDAALHGWAQAPYTRKVEVDANFKRMVTYGCTPAHTKAVHLGVASHNLFDVAYALLLRQDQGLSNNEVEFEMLEGMANHQARTVQQHAGGLLLYAPVVKSDDFHSAIAYLVRRLDENTTPENFLHDLFGLQADSPAWNRQRDRFLAACTQISEVSERARRRQDRHTLEPAITANQPFANTPDTDFSLPANVDWVREIYSNWSRRNIDIEPIPLQIDWAFVEGATQVDGHDPSRPEIIAYRYAQAGAMQVEQALAVASQAHAEWSARSIEGRTALLGAAATELANRRGNLIGAMILDTAKTVSEADAEVSEAVDFAHYYAHALDAAQEFADCRPTPLGVVVVTPPWNFPLAIPAGGVLAALMAGNSVILKPAPEAVLVGWQLAQALWAAGIPKDVLQFLPCPDNDIGRALVTDDRIGAVILTGSIETAQLFLSWKPTLRLFAETSGKNSLIISAMADQDQAIKDLVRSAFGHNGQKCSAASLAICEAEVYDDPTFRRQLRDAVASLQVGSAWEAASSITPLTQPASDKLQRAITSLDEGEEWLLEPQQHEDNPQLWSPGIKLGVQPGSFFHQTECFGPVLGLMRAVDLDEAISLANATEYGLTSGIHSLDDREVIYWKERIQAGNLYINRHITGAIVQRQPFGGWKRSTVGPGAKAGGPNYVLQLMHWEQAHLSDPRSDLPPALIVLLARLLEQIPSADAQQVLRASAGSYLRAWQTHFSQEHDPSQILGEANPFRYKPCRGLILRIGAQTPVAAVAQVILAVRTTGQDIALSVPPAQADQWEWLTNDPTMVPNLTLIVEDEDELINRIASNAYDRLRALAPLSSDVQRAAHAAYVNIANAPVVANGRLELRWYLREQSISHTRHRYGNLLS